MPNRILRGDILTSERVASLDWAAEVFYRRLHSIVDDYGRHEAGHQLLRAKCYPLQTDSVRVADIARWMAACQKSGLILVYGNNGKQYLEVCNFGQQQRSPSKCPAPADSCEPLIANDINCEQVITNAHLDVSVSVSDKAIDRQVDRFPDFWGKYPKRVGRKPAADKWRAKKLDQHADAILADVSARIVGDKQWMDGFVPNPATYLTQERWHDDWRNAAGTSAPSAVPSGPPKGPSETKLESAVAYARQQHGYGVIDAAERDRLIAVATEKHRSQPCTA